MTAFGWIALGCVALFGGLSFWAGWIARARLEARRKYREEHPRYQHSGAQRVG